MKLTPYYLLFTLAFLGLLGQKAYEYKLEQDDKKEVFCKNALFLLQAPDSLSNRLVDFDLPYDSLVKELKNNVFLDSCNTDYFEFASKVKFPIKDKSDQVVGLFTFYIKYQSNCFVNSYTSCFDIRYRVNYNNNLENYRESSFEKNSVPLDSLEKMIKRRESINENDFQIRIILVFNDKSNQAFLEKVCSIVSEMSIENYKDAALRNYGKQLCNLTKDEIIDLKTRISSPKIEVQLKLSFPHPPPPPPK